MFKKITASNLNYEVLEVFNNPLFCVKCGKELNIKKSKNGEIMCEKCGFKNKIAEISNGQNSTN
jgi:NMD protein affecting ribosome stability and mRNA decay